MNRLPNFFRNLLKTITYVTCFRIGDFGFDQSETSLRGLSKYLPLAGIMIGTCLAVAAATLAKLSAPNMVGGVILTLLWFVLTNGLHLDGLMDTADGIFSHQSQEHMLTIMQDPRVGNFGVLAGIFLLLSKYSALSSLTAPSICLLLLTIPAWARFAEVYAIGRFPYLRTEGKGKVWHDSTVFPRDLWLAAMFPALYTVVILIISDHPIQILLALIATIGSGITTGHWLTKKLGGQTGDTYGSAVEIAEATGILTASLLLH